MKNEITRAEKLSDALPGIDDDLLDEAIRIDSARKLKIANHRFSPVRNLFGKSVAIIASIVLVAGIVSAIPRLDVLQNSDLQTSVLESSSTVTPSNGTIHSELSVFNFDSMAEISGFLAAAKISSAEYNDYYLEMGISDPIPFEIAKKIAYTILTSEYHVRLKDGVAAEGFTALYTNDGILRFAFTVGQTKYVLSHFYGVTSTADHSQDRAIGTAVLGGATVIVFSGEDHFFADEVFGNTRIYIAAFTDCADEDIFSVFEIIPTSEAFND